MADHIPNDLLIEILARLPVASLLRFKSLCKPWYSLITSPSFVTKRLNQSITNSKRNGSQHLIRLYDNNGNKERYLLLNDDDKFGDEYSELESPFKLQVRYLLLNDDDKFGDEYSKLESPFKLQFRYRRVVGSCNGLLCLCDEYYCESVTSLRLLYGIHRLESRIIIWNPSTRKSVALPKAPKQQCCLNISVYGFGAHPTTQEYKVIRIEYQVNFKPHTRVPLIVEIYSQGTRSWRGIGSAPPPHCFVTSMSSQAFLNGVVHWVARDPCKEGGLPNSIMLFDMASESFSEIMLPPTLATDQNRKSLSIHVFGESLAVSCTGERDGGCASSIWLMKEYGVAESWTKLFSSKLLGKPNKTLGFRKNGEVLLASANSLASYAPGTITLAKTGIIGTANTFYVYPFMETLVSVE